MEIKNSFNYSKIEELGEGFRSKSYIVDNNYILLIGCNKNSYKTYKKDYKTLMFLKDKIKSVEIPSDIKLIEISDEFPYGGLLYNLINDKVFSYENINKYNLNGIADGLSSFLNELHSISIEYDYEKIVNNDIKLLDDNISAINKYLSDPLKKKLSNFRTRYLKYIKTHKKLCLTHGDFWYENYIISKDGSKLTGIIDFENSKPFYPEDDLVPMLYISESFLDMVLKSYKKKIDKKIIYLFMIRREVVSFNYLMKYFPEEQEEQIEKINNVLNKYIV